MNELQTKLKSVPAITKQELLFYIHEKFPSTFLRIVTEGGFYYTGIIITLATTRGSNTILVLQIADERSGLLERFLHIPVQKIESVELINPVDLITILSLGKAIDSSNYEASGKLEVKRGFQNFSDVIANASGVKIGVPKMDLPDDGIALNRIVKLTQQIQQIIVALLKDEDACASWKTNFQGITFINQDLLKVKSANGVVEIYFPFENVSAPEISSKELTNSLLSIL